MKTRIALAALVAAALFVCPAQATLTSTSNTVSYVGNGSTTSFTVPFKFLAAADLVVTVNGIPKVLNADYTVTGVGNATGTVKFTVAPASALPVIVTRVVDYTQKTSFAQNRTFDPKAMSDALDKLTMQNQQIANTAASAAQTGLLTAADWNRFNGTVFTSINQFQAPFTGAVTRAISSKLGDVLSVKDFNVKCDGVTNDTANMDLALAASLASGLPLSFPPGMCLRTTPLALHVGQRIIGSNQRGNNEAGYINSGSTGTGATVLRNTTGGHVIEITSGDTTYRHDIEIAWLVLDNEGMGGSGDGISIHNNVSGTGAWNLRMHDLTIRKVGGRGIYVDQLWNSTLRDIIIDSTTGHAVEIGTSSNTVVIDHVYPGIVGTNKAAFRVHNGQITLIGANGIGGGTNVDWGVFGDLAGDVNPDGTTDATSQVVQTTLIQCNVEAWTNRGVVMKRTSGLKLINSKFTAWAANTKAIVYDTAPAGSIIDDSNVFQLATGGTWANGYPVHVNSTGPLTIGRPNGMWDSNNGNRAWDDGAVAVFNLPAIEVGVGPSLRIWPLSLGSQGRNNTSTRLYGWSTGSANWTPGVVPAVSAGVPGSVSTTVSVNYAVIGDLALGSYDGAALPAGVELQAKVTAGGSPGTVTVTIYNFTASPTSSLPAGKAWATIIINDATK